MTIAPSCQYYSVNTIMMVIRRSGPRSWAAVSTMYCTIALYSLPEFGYNVQIRVGSGEVSSSKVGYTASRRVCRWLTPAWVGVEGMLAGGYPSNSDTPAQPKGKPRPSHINEYMMA